MKKKLKISAKVTLGCLLDTQMETILGFYRGLFRIRKCRDAARFANIILTSALRYPIPSSYKGSRTIISVITYSPP